VPERPPVPGGNARQLMRKLTELWSKGGTAEERLDRLVVMIAHTMVADVCSIYLRRGEVLELFATEGLKRDAVHRTQLRLGEGLVGLIATTARPLNLADAPSHPNFSYRPETGEDPFSTFLGVPITLDGRVVGVLVVQNRRGTGYADEDVEGLLVISTLLAELVKSGDLGTTQALAGVEVRPTAPMRLPGRVFADGLAIGQVVLHDPQVSPTRLFSEDVEQEEARLEEALGRLEASVQAMLEGEHLPGDGVPRDVLETYQLMAADRSWRARLRDAVRRGLTAEAAVNTARSEHRARLANASDPYLRERLRDLEDLDNRMLRLLAGRDAAPQGLPDDAVLVARDLGPAELLEYGAGRLRAIALEEGGPSSHAVIVARALGIPVVGLCRGLIAQVETGHRIVVDGEKGEVHLRPDIEVVESVVARIALGAQRSEEDRALALVPAVTRDGLAVTLAMNAGLSFDLDRLDLVGAQGVGLFRTEFQFLIADQMPRLAEQTALYREVLDKAGDRPVTFRTLDLGGDKVTPYLHRDREENPALGWRAIRIGLDRPGLLRYQLRALVEAAAGRRLCVMFPLVAMPDEFTAAKALLERELERAHQRGRAPAIVEVGVMLEAPSLAFALEALSGHAQFVCIGTNDLMQYFFAADRANPRTADRYDILAPAALRFLAEIEARARAAGLDITVCGEAAGRPIEALALVALGYRRLSMPMSGFGPVKRMLLSVHLAEARAEVLRLMLTPVSTIRPELKKWLERAASSPRSVDSGIRPG